MDLFHLKAVLGLDSSEYEKGISNAKATLDGLGSVVGVVGAATTAFASASIAAATAVGAVAKQATDAYSSYQQLAGGIETLFDDQQAMNMVMENASNAYKTAGMSTNDYMDTVINMAASLNKATGDYVESAKLADVAITDMSDNVNKMGTSMEAVQNAYRGFTRGNFTMLDNLALGYAGTKEGMEELLADAEKISGIKYDVSSYADIVNAIHVVQENMGITGTTAKEASDTVSGSMGAMKAAWDNLILGLADPDADLGALIDNMAQSVKSALGNMIPVFTQAINGVGKLVGEIAPVITAELPGIIDEVLPSLLDAAESLLSNITSALPGLIGSIVDNIVPSLVNIVLQVADSLVTGVLDLFPTLLSTAVQLVTKLADGLSQIIPTLIPQIMSVVVELLNVITSPETLIQLGKSAAALMKGLFEGIIKAIPILIKAIPVVIGNFVSGLLGGVGEILKVIPEMWDVIIEAITGENNTQEIIDGITGMIEQIGNSFIDYADTILEFVNEFFEYMGNSDEYGEGIINMVTSIIDAVIDFIDEYLPQFEEKLIPIAEQLWPRIIELVGRMFEKYAEIVEMIAPYISKVVEGLTGVLLESGTLQIMIKGWVDMFTLIVKALPDIIKPLLTAVPSIIVDLVNALIECIPDLIECGIAITVAIVEALPDIIKALVDATPDIINALIEGFIENDITQAFVDMFTDVWNAVTKAFDGFIDDALFWGKDFIDTFVKGITDNLPSLEDAVGENGVTGKVRKFMHFSEPDEGPLSDFHTYAPDMMELFAKGIKDNTPTVTDAVKNAFDFGGMINQGFNGVSGGGLITPTANKNVTIVLELDKTQFAKTVFNLNNMESQRMGVKLANV